MLDQLVLAAALDRSARLFQRHEALVDDNEKISHGELKNLRDKICNACVLSGLVKGDIVAFLCRPSITHAAFELSCFSMGAIAVSLHIRESFHDLEEMVLWLKPKMLIFDAEFHAAVSHLLEHFPHLKAISIAEPGHAEAITFEEFLRIDEIKPSSQRVFEVDPALMVFTSGSSGTPKGIVHSNRTLMMSSFILQHQWRGISTRDCIVTPFYPSTIGWFLQTFPFLHSGAKVVYVQKWNAKQFLRKVEKERATIVGLLPIMWRDILTEISNDSFDISSLRLVASTGSLASKELLLAIREKITPNVQVLYGTTETLSSGTVLRPEDFPDKADSVGIPQLGTDIRIVKLRSDNARTMPDETVPPNEIGMILVRGPSVADRVWENPEDEETFYQGWWYSRDVGFVDDDGFIHLVGRADLLINVGGIKISPESIESVLKTHPQIIEAIVVGVADPRYGHILKVFIKASGLLNAKDVEIWCEDKLPLYKRPRIFEIVNDFPLTASGKVDRKKLQP
jgi:long-chain acyl-CoA synthetase